MPLSLGVRIFKAHLVMLPLASVLTTLEMGISFEHKKIMVSIIYDTI